MGKPGNRPKYGAKYGDEIWGKYGDRRDVHRSPFVETLGNVRLSSASRTSRRELSFPLTRRTGAPYTWFMEVRLTPEQQQQLAELASQRGRDADALAQEAISRYLAEEARFVEAVKLGEAALDRGEYLTHQQVGERLDRLFRS